MKEWTKNHQKSLQYVVFRTTKHQTAPLFLGKLPKLESGSKTTPKTETLGEEQPVKYGVFWIM